MTTQTKHYKPGMLRESVKPGPVNLNGKLFFKLLDNSVISCDCIGEPYVSQILELWKHRDDTT